MTPGSHKLSFLLCQMDAILAQIIDGKVAYYKLWQLSFLTKMHGNDDVTKEFLGNPNEIEARDRLMQPAILQKPFVVDFLNCN